MKNLAFALWLLCGVARAAGPLLGLELESEKNNKSGISNFAVEIAPGWKFAEGNLISRVELLIQKNRDDRAEDGGLVAKENKIFLRIRHDGDISESLEYYIRGGVGRSFNNERDFNYAYIEPGIEYKLPKNWAWILAIRETNAIDSKTGKHITQVRTGPSYEFGENNELELVYAKGHGDADLSSWVLEYVHTF